jgi:hypothetical protein
MMLTIRKDQIDALEQSARRRFEDDMVAHIGAFAPRHSEVLGEEGIRRVIRLGMERSAAHGLTLRGPVRFYIESMFMFGSHFDRDPQLPWASEALADGAMSDEIARADLLYARAMKYAEAVGGPGACYQVEALRRLAQEDVEHLPDEEAMLDEYALSRMKVVYPQKWEYVGEPTMRLLVRSARELAGRLGLTSTLGKATLIGLMFALGHGSAEDPLYPWIGSTLAKSAVEDPDIRAERLFSKSQTYLKHVLSGLDARN